ncbi:Molybdenum cofactor biosynthesis protein 1 [Papilio machaon]|uniref:GTP 3',8-cyclase n=1 Tax=Papilio machaon TaxID=76193 RepID=A0A194RJG5_PAPMA|nr:Molybdenum cofactor biosynthesis protein 1 [Papilio machaon]
MKGYSNNFLILLRATALKSDAKLRLAKPIFGNESKFYSDVANVANKMDLTSAAVKSTAPLQDLLGRRHDYLRISLTERCNLRCQYCMPAEGVPLTPKPDLLTKEELYRLVNVFASLGVHKIRLTGGEPTLRSDLAEIIEQLCSVPGIRTVAMTTNGLVLTRRLPAYQRAGLSAINVSLDSLQPEKYERMARRPGLKKVLAGIDLALQLGYRPVKVNTVLMRGFNDDEICDFVEFTRDREVEVRFIEFMPFTGNRWDDSHMVPHEVALRAVRHAYPRLAPTLPRACDTAAVWQVEGYAGSVGFISSMTQPFCSSCNRLRLTADGNLKVCLFGAAEVSLREVLRAGTSDADLETLIRTALRNKKPQHAARRLPRPRPRPRARPHVLAHRLAMPTPLAARAYCTAPPTLSHLDGEGRARMVDVGGKRVTARAAEAECLVRVSARLLRLLRDASLPKGDALTVAQVAGALAAKRTAELIPMCHPLALDYARVRITLPRGECAHGGLVRVTCAAAATARTGVEMEALTGAALAALALYDMCKSVDRHMVITELRVLSKSGGAHDFGGPPAQEPAPAVRAHDTSPIKPNETYAPTDVMHF